MTYRGTATRRSLIRWRATLAAVVTAYMIASAVALAVAKVGSLEFDKLVTCSEMIVLAKVISLSTGPTSYAQATVIEVWKGAKSKSVEFLATPWWTCDSSSAVVGETVVLFLAKGQASRSYIIQHSGIGRLHVSTVRDKSCVTVTSMTVLPPKTSTVVSPAPMSDGLKLVELGVLREMVKRQLDPLPAPRIKT